MDHCHIYIDCLSRRERQRAVAFDTVVRQRFRLCCWRCSSARDQLEFFPGQRTALSLHCVHRAPMQCPWALPC